MLKYGQNKTMILKDLKIFSQNVHKNYLLTNLILENNKNFDIVFIQEPPWSIIWTILSLTSEEDEEIISTSNYLLWAIFSKQLVNENKHPRVITYINVKLFQLQFLLRKDIMNYRDINLISFLIIALFVSLLTSIPTINRLSQNI